MVIKNPRIIGTLVGASALAASFIVPFEGKSNVAYLDPPGVATICHGHTKGVTLNQTATDAQCVVWLGDDVKEADAAVDRLVKVELSDTTKGAFISFVFNVGAGNFAKSTALKKLNQNDIAGGCNELPKWVYSGGKILPGLVRRRAAERDLCLKGISP